MPVVLQHGDASAPGQLWGASYAVYCNECDAPIENEHYHCSVCAGGDFDLCCDCVNAGQLCDDEDHWLIKRFIKDGRVINSTTERLGPHSRADTGASAGAVESSRSAPAAPRASVDERSDAPEEVAARTCNSCVEGTPRTVIACGSAATLTLGAGSLWRDAFRGVHRV